MNPALRLGALALLLTSVTACGGDDTSGASGDGSASGTGSAASSGPAASGDVVEVKGTPALRFEPSTLTATAGTEFRGKLVQVGSVPHNIEFKDFGVKGGDTLTTKDGDSKEFSFTPSEAGEFTYVCTVHPATMKGKLTVS